MTSWPQFLDDKGRRILKSHPCPRTKKIRCDNFTQSMRCPTFYPFSIVFTCPMLPFSTCFSVSASLIECQCSIEQIKFHFGKIEYTGNCLFLQLRNCRKLRKGITFHFISELKMRSPRILVAFVPVVSLNPRWAFDPYLSGYGNAGFMSRLCWLLFYVTYSHEDCDIHIYFIIQNSFSGISFCTIYQNIARPCMDISNKKNRIPIYIKLLIKLSLVLSHSSLLGPDAL